MTRNAEQTASNAEAQTHNDPGMCLQWSRQRADIAALHPDAATAWKHATNRHKGDPGVPRGGMAYWTGGSKGYGHIAVGVGGGKVRSTDAGGSGKVATVSVGYIADVWGLTYAGWADNVNDVVIPGVGSGGDDDMQTSDMITEWSPDDGSTGEMSVGQSLNQARGYSEDSYERIKKLEKAVSSLQSDVDKILKAVT